MRDEDKTKAQLIKELEELRQQVAELETAEAERKRTEEWIKGQNRLKEALLCSGSLDEKLKRITDGVVAIFDADFARIWITKPGDLCDSGCFHAKVTEGPHVCHYRDRCLYLMASSGRYTHIDGEVHQRVPFGCYKIGRVAAGEDPKFITNDVTHDPRVHDHTWARKLGLTSFAGYRLLSAAGKPIGVLALFSKHVISPKEDALLEGLANTTAQVIQTSTAEEALGESEHRLSLAAEVGNLGMWEWRIDTGKIFANNKLLEITGLTQEETEHFSLELWLSKMHPNDRTRTRENGQSLLKGETERVENEHRVWHPKKGWIWLSGVGRIIERDTEGRPVCIVGVHQDTTARKRVEEELEQYRHHLETLVKERTAELNKVNAELVRANRLKDEFLATMSHELRTPLHVILGMSESLQEEVYGSLNDRQLKSLRMIEESGRHLLTLINDVLDLSKISTGKLELEIAPVFVESICQASLRFIKQFAQKKRLKVSSMFDSHVTTIQADGRRLKQVLVNLLSNAVKFTPEGGKIGLEVEGDFDQQAVHFTVWDTGIGIAQDDMERLFQPFVQLDASLSRKYEGTGLGLSLVYRMVEMHGGSVSVESEVGQGSHFTVSLPWKEVDDTSLPASKGELGPPTSRTPQLATRNSQLVTRTILIAEDNEATITTLSGYFAAKGYRVLIARNGWEVFALTREAHPDFIVMDIQTPEMDGLEAIRHIRSDQHGKSIPIIALTALVMPGDQGKCLAAGADEYLSKPVSLRRLSEAIEHLLSRKE